MKLKEVILLVFLLIVDIASKYYMESILFIGTPIVIIPNFFQLNLVYNTGAAWGILSGKSELFFVITILVVGLIGSFLFSSKDKKTFFRIALIMILAGTLGNFYDRVVFSRVRDFLDFFIFGYDYPVFNVADILLCLGFAFVAIYYLRHSEEFDE